MECHILLLKKYDIYLLLFDGGTKDNSFIILPLWFEGSVNLKMDGRGSFVRLFFLSYSIPPKFGNSVSVVNVSGFTTLENCSFSIL